MAFGPDIFQEAASMPAKKRIGLLFPGFGKDPYHNLNHRQEFLDIIENHYDLVFVNPGPLEYAYSSSPKISIVPFSIDPQTVKFKSYRQRSIPYYMFPILGHKRTGKEVSGLCS